MGTEKIVLSGNSADVTGEVDAWGEAGGGSVYSETGEIRVEGGTVEITNNVVSADQGDAQGGALFTRSGNVNISGDSVTISSNAAYAGMRPQEEHTMGDEAHAYGGAVDATGALYVESTGTITISDNSAESRLVRLPEASGGALYSKGDMTVSGDKLNITNNHVRANEEGAMAEGGALYGEEGAERLLLHGSEILLSGNSADAEGEDAEAYGGAILGKLGAAVSIDSRGALTVTDNLANVSGDAAHAKGGAILGNRDEGDDAVALKGVQVLLSGNETQAKGEDTAAYGGAVYAIYGNITLTGSETLELSGNAAKAAGGYAYACGGAIVADHDSDYADNDGGDVNLSTLGTLSLSGNSAVADGEESQALGGTIYATGDVTLSGAKIDVRDNFASASGADSTAWAGAIIAGGDVSLTADDSIVFSGNYAESGTLNKKASLGGAVYVIGNAEMTAKTLEFATATDDVFARGSITLTGALTAAPGTAFTAGGQFAMGADNTSSLMLTAQPFTDVAAERMPGDLTIFGGAADTANGTKNAINFNRAPLTVYSTGMYARDGRAYMDVATVLYRNDPQLITSGNSADITEKTWAPDVSAYRGGKLYIHSAVTKTDEQTSAIQDALELGYTAKLVLAYDRRALIWRAQDAPWNEAVAANTAWVQGSDDIFTPYVEDNSYVADSFWRGDVVVFDGKVYDELTPGAEKPASGVVEVPIDAAGVAPAQVYVTGGQNHFTGGPLSAGKLFVRGSSTSADFAGTVNAADLVSVDQAAVSFAELAAQVSTPVEIGGTVTVKNAANGVYTVSEGGNLTLAGGTGTLTGLTLDSGAALNVNTLSSYSVSDSFIAADGSSTVFDFGGDWAPEDGFGIGGSGTAEAAVKGAAVLTINGIAEGTTGSWKLLDKFESVAVDSTAWSYTYGRTDNTLKINTSAGTARGDLADYVVTAKAADGAYVLTITRPEGDLIWNGSGSDTWSASGAGRAWLIAESGDPDAPFEYEGRTFADEFADGKIVTFNKVGASQQNVTVSGGVSVPQLRVTAGNYAFNGSGAIEAHSLLIDDSIFGAGTSVSFDVPVSVSESLESGAGTTAWLTELNMGEETAANVSGQLELANAAGGVFTVTDGGTLTLAGGTGTLTGLTLDNGAALNVNTLSSYSVTDSFIAADGSSTVFDFGGDWTPEDGFGIGGSGTAEAAVKGAAVLTINGIAEGTTGSWKLLDKFESVAVDSTAWSYTYGRADNTLKINTSDGTARGDLADYVVTAKAADGAYVLTITRPEGDLIWNGSGSDTWSASGAGRAWLIAESGDPDALFEYEGRTFADEFADGKIVTFNKVGASQQNVTVSGGVSVPQLRVTAGNYAFNGSGAIEAHSLLIDDSKFGTGTQVSFDVPVSVSESLESGAGTTAWLNELNMGEATAANVSGQLELANAAGGVFTVTDSGTLTLAGGTGTLTGLTLYSGAALNVNALSSYSVSDSFSALGGSVTYFGFDSWAPDDNSAWAIGGGSSAVLSSGAKLTIAGITPGDTGKWTLLSGFKNITADGWTADDITITDYDLSGYTVKAYIDGADYVLEISREKPEPPTPPDGDLIWNGTGSDTWSVSPAKPWLVASSADLDKPYEEGGSTYSSAFADGKTVTFNAIGKAQQNVTVNGDVSAGQVRVTAGEYKFGGDGKITAKELLTAGSGTTAVFDTPLSVKEKLDIGADTKAKLADLSMELNAPAAVAGRLELAKAAGGVFTVNKGGELTLAGGEGSLTGLTVESGATLNVNALSSYSVTDSFSALGGSVTYFSFDNWRADDSSAWGISGGGTAEADLGSGAKLTVSGIKLGAGKWTLLSGFKSITAGGWSKDDITFADYDDLTGYTVAAYDDGAGNYVLEITKEEPVPPVSSDPGHTEAFHIASSAQSSVSAAAEKAALGLLSVEPTVEKALWAHVWRDTGRVYDADSALSQKNRAYGIVIGRDLSRNEKSTWGVAAHIGKGDTSGKGAWDGSTSNTDFAGVLLYGRHEIGRWLLTGDAGMSWLRTDYNEAGGAKADNARSTMFSVGGRAYYKWVENNAPGKMNVSPFVGLRWNRYRQSAYDYDSGDRSAAYTADQLLVPMGVKFSWGESVSKKGWRTAPSFELSYIRAFGDRSAKTGIAAKGRKNTLADTPLSDRDTFSAQVRYGARRNNFQWDLNVGVRRSSSETDHAVGATFRWDL